MTPHALHPKAFATLLAVACLFAANHVAARAAFDHGMDVATAVAVRSLSTAAVVAGLALLAAAPWRLAPRARRAMPVIGVLVGVQSLCLYSAVARLPVALALLAFNTYPLWTALAARLLYRHRPERAVLVAMPVILVGLALALDAGGASSGLGARAQWSQIGAGVAFAVGAAAAFGLALVLTQHEATGLDGRVRTALTMTIVGVLALAGALAQGGLHWPTAPPGWWGLALLTLFYGTAITTMFTLLPRLGVVANSPVLNVEPVASLVLAWWVLGQAVAPLQVVGALLVVGAVMGLALRRR